MRDNICRKGLILIIIVLFVGTTFTPSLSGDIYFDESIFKPSNNLINILQKTFKFNNGNWSEQAKINALDGASDDNFGCSVSISGDYAIIGAFKDNDNGDLSGSAYIFTRNDSNWTQQAKLKPSDGADGNRFGWSVSIDSNYAIVGAYGDDDSGSYSGSAYIFTHIGSNWTQQTKLLASDGTTGDFFGWSVSIDSNYAIVGAYGDDDNGLSSGSAYIFTHIGSNWTQQTKLIPSDGESGNHFGWSVSIDSNYAIIGALYSDYHDGSAYIFKRTFTTWSEVEKLDAGVLQGFGYSVSIGGEYAIVGGPFDNENGHYSGCAYIYSNSGSNWTQQVKLLALDGAAGDNFGGSVSIDNNYAIIGAQSNDDSGSSSGSVYIFASSGSNWTQQVKLLASDGESDDKFGSSVSIDSNYVIIGAIGNNDNGNDSGSGYVFVSDYTSNQIPTVEITYPTEGNNVSSIINITGNADDPDGFVELVEVKIDNNNWEDASGTNIWSYQWDTTKFSNGYHTIYARSYDGQDYSNIKIVNVTIENYVNQLPTVEITNPSEGNTVTGIITITGIADDPDGTVELVELKIDTNSWKEASGTYSWNYIWNTTNVTDGWHTIYARSFDGIDYSEIYLISVIVDNSNNPPLHPIINGPTSGKPGETYVYGFNSIDPDGDDIEMYIVDWGDDTSEETIIGPFISGEEVKASHTWSSKGTYIINAKAKDINGAESDWSEFWVNIPRNRPLNFNLMIRLFEIFPILERLLSFIR